MKVTSMILTQERITPDPKVYMGRGARVRDLSGEMLATMYRKIKEELGDEEATEFVTMVQNVKLLSLAKFIKSLQALEDNNWQYDAEKQAEINREEETELYALYSSRRNDTSYIKNVFLAEIGQKHDSLALKFEGYMRAIHSGRDKDCYSDFDNDYGDDDCEEYE